MIYPYMYKDFCVRSSVTTTDHAYYTRTYTHIRTYTRIHTHTHAYTRRHLSPFRNVWKIIAVIIFAIYNTATNIFIRHHYSIHTRRRRVYLVGT